MCDRLPRKLMAGSSVSASAAAAAATYLLARRTKKMER
jgi:hypothetical protein